MPRFAHALVTAFLVLSSWNCGLLLKTQDHGSRSISVVYGNGSWLGYYELRRHPTQGVYQLIRMKVVLTDPPQPAFQEEVVDLSAETGRSLESRFDREIAWDPRSYCLTIKPSPEPLDIHACDVYCGRIADDSKVVMACPITGATFANHSDAANSAARIILTMEQIVATGPSSTTNAATTGLLKVYEALPLHLERTILCAESRQRAPCPQPIDIAARLRGDIAAALVMSGAVADPMSHPDVDIRIAGTYRYLVSESYPDAVSGLSSGLKDPIPTVRMYSASALAAIVQTSDGATLETLRTFLDAERDESVRHPVQATLADRGLLVQH